MTDENDRVMLSTQPHGNLLEFLANVDKLRTRFKDRFKMTKEATEKKDSGKAAKTKEEKITETNRNAESQQRVLNQQIYLRERRPWNTDQQRFGRFVTQRRQDFPQPRFRPPNNWQEDRRGWQNVPRAGEAQGRDWEPIRQLDNYHNVERSNNYNQPGFNPDRRWNPDPRPPWQQRNNPNQPRMQGLEQRRPPWRGQGNQPRGEGYGNPRYDRPNQGGRPGPSYWAREAEGAAPREENHRNRSPNRGPNDRRALN